MTTYRELIFESIEDLVSDLLYYDRKDDEFLPVGVIEKCVKNGQIQVYEMVDEFRKNLENKLG